jgi:2',3'-cyclic-nucleotide 2'-phosphodiesterase (5'-nucleotidase family)
MEADAAIVASGQFHQPLEAGVLTLGQLDRACFSSANPEVTEISGRDLLAALERGLDPENTTNKHGGLRGSPYGLPQISGLVVHFNPDAPIGKRVIAVELNRKPVDLSRPYRLAHTDAETISDLGYLILEPAHKTHSEVPTILREVLADYIQAHSPVPEPKRGRWIRI